MAIVCLCLFSVFYLLFSLSTSERVIGFITLFTFLICYVTGYNFVRDIQTVEMTERMIIILMSVLMGGNFLHFLLNLIYNYGAIAYRNTIDIWSGQVMSATGQSALACFPIGIAGAVLFSDCKKKYKWIMFCILGVVVYYNLILAGRTIFFMLIVILILAYGNYLVYDGNKSNKGKKLLGVIGVFTLLFLAYEQDFIGLKTIVEDSNFYSRFLNLHAAENVLQDSRMSIKMEYIRRLLEYPWGGRHIKHEIGHYAHDLLLDIYDEAGIFAFAAMSGYILTTFNNLCKMMRSKDISFFVKQAIFCLYIAIYIEFFIEPIIAGLPWLLVQFCLIDGSVTYMLRVTKRKGGTVNADCGN